MSCVMQYTMPRTMANVRKKLTEARNNRRRGRSAICSRIIPPSGVRCNASIINASITMRTARSIQCIPNTRRENDARVKCNSRQLVIPSAMQDLCILDMKWEFSRYDVL